MCKKKIFKKKQFKLKKSYNYKEDIIKMTRFNYNDQVNRIKFLKDSSWNFHWSKWYIYF